MKQQEAINKAYDSALQRMTVLASGILFFLIVLPMTIDNWHNLERLSYVLRNTDWVNLEWGKLLLNALREMRGFLIFVCIFLAWARICLLARRNSFNKQNNPSEE